MSQIIQKHAISYHKLGLNVTCLSSKENRFNISNIKKAPSHKWKMLQIKRQDLQELLDYHWLDAQGVGCVLGYNGIRCIDIDDCSDENFIKELLDFLDLPKNYDWCIKTPNGYHIYVICKQLPFTTQELQQGILAMLPNDTNKLFFSRVEFRWAGHCVLPANGDFSIHYDFLFTDNRQMPKTLPKRIKLVNVFKALCNLSGEYTYHHSHPKYTGDKYIESGKIEVGQFIAKFAYSSDYGWFECFNKDKKLVLSDSFQYDGIYKVDSPHYTSKVYLDIKTNGLIEDRFDLENYPRIIQVAFKIDDKLFDYHVTLGDLLVNRKTNYPTSNEIPIEDILFYLKLYTCNRNDLIIGYNFDSKLSVLENEIRIAPQTKHGIKFMYENPVSRLDKYDIVAEFAKQNGSKYLEITELYEHFFDDNIEFEDISSKDAIRIIYNIYNIMMLYGY